MTTRKPSGEGGATRPPFTLDSLIGRVLDDRYQIEELVGMGAMGAVFRALQLRLRRSVAIKVPKPEHCSNPEFLARFEREALTMAKLVHENIVQIHDVHMSPDPAWPSYIAMEFVAGKDLEKFLRAEEQSITIGEVADLLRAIARGIDAAHHLGIVHRDIKPGNIIVTMPRRVPKIMDYGIARVEMEGVFTTSDTSTIGTPAYMAPEQVRGGEVDAAADVYAFAMTIYRVLTRRIAYDAKNTTNLLYAQVNDPPIPAHVRNPLLPREVQEALGPALAKKPEDRPASAVILAEHVAAALSTMAEHKYGSLFGETTEPIVLPRQAVETVTAQRTEESVPDLVPRRRFAAWGIGAAGIGCAGLIAYVLAAAPGSKPSMSGETSAAATPAGGDSIEAAPTPALVARALPAPSPEARPATPYPAATEALALASPPPPTPEATLLQPPTESVAAPATSPPKAEWSPPSEPPLARGVRRRAILDTVERHLRDAVLVPLAQGDYASQTTALGAIDSPSARDLRMALAVLSQDYGNLSVSLARVEDATSAWPESVAYGAILTVTGRPHSRREEDYRERIFRSAAPVTFKVSLAREGWVLRGFDAKLMELSAISRKAPPR